MAKLTTRTELTVAADTDILHAVEDPGGTPVSKKITVANLLKSAKPISLAVADLNDPTTPHALTTAETTDKVISNYASSGADRVFTMPAAHINGSAVFVVGDEFQVGIAPGSTEYTAKSVILDIADGQGNTTFLSIRQIDFYFEGSKITMLPANFTAYGTTNSGANYLPEKAFDTSLSLIGTSSGTSWQGDTYSITNQRLIIVFNSEQTFDKIVINNAHASGGGTDRGANNVVINISTDAITSTVYNEAIANSTEIFNGVFTEHTASDVEDDQNLTWEDLFYLNGTAMAAGEHIQNIADTLGDQIVFFVANINGTLTWMAQSSNANWVEETP